jgi:hypothetical protein
MRLAVMSHIHGSLLAGHLGALNKSVDDDGDDDGNGIEQFSAPGN